MESEQFGKISRQDGERNGQMGEGYLHAASKTATLIQGRGKSVDKANEGEGSSGISDNCLFQSTVGRKLKRGNLPVDRRTGDINWLWSGKERET